jgi:hypothetical protein
MPQRPAPIRRPQQRPGAVPATPKPRSDPIEQALARLEALLRTAAARSGETLRRPIGRLEFDLDGIEPVAPEGRGRRAPPALGRPDHGRYLSSSTAVASWSGARGVADG